MRKTLINLFCFGLIGGFLANIGATIDTVHFWVISLSAVVVQINNGVD